MIASRPSQLLVAAVTVAFLLATPATACTRCLHVFGDGTVIVGRSMDWMEDPGSEIWCFPHGLERQGNAGPRSLTWTSRYGSVGVSFYGVATACGMNEEGLVANLLYLAESDYGKPGPDRPTLSIGAWAQYVLDSYATVAAAVTELRKEPFTIIAPMLPKDLTGTHAIASVFSVIRNASAPLGITTPGEPNVASTIWRTVHDQKDRVLYFDSATSPTVFWIPLKKVDFSAAGGVKRLPLKGGETYNGDASAGFRSATAFQFLKATAE